jgi:cardiolipin synthase
LFLRRLGYLGSIPLWLVVVVILRDLVIISGAELSLSGQQVTAAPRMISKLNTFAQILLVLAVMFDRGIQELPALWLVSCSRYCFPPVERAGLCMDQGTQGWLRRDS